MNKSDIPGYKKVDDSRIIIKSSPIHGTGVIAASDIKKGQEVIEYVGEIISKDEAEIRAENEINNNSQDPSKGAVYIFELNKVADIDGNVKWNPARFINHSCDPNCESETKNDCIIISAIKDIKKGEELTYDYGYDMDSYKDHPCRCGSKNCIGYIVAEKHKKRLTKKLEKKSKDPR